MQAQDAAPGSIIVCAECGSNFIGDGVRDYVCPTFGVGKCSNNLRVRRDEAHSAVFELIKAKLLDEKAIKHAQRRFEAYLERVQHEAEDTATRSEDMLRIERQIAELRKLASGGTLSPAVAQAAIAQAERERQDAATRGNGKHAQRLTRARDACRRLPDLLQSYRAQVQNALKVVSDPDRVHEARESTRRWIEGGRIALKPNGKRTALEGAVTFTGLETQLLAVPAAGVRKDGSGGMLWIRSWRDIALINMGRKPRKKNT